MQIYNPLGSSNIPITLRLSFPALSRFVYPDGTSFVPAVSAKTSSRSNNSGQSSPMSQATPSTSKLVDGRTKSRILTSRVEQPMESLSPKLDDFPSRHDIQSGDRDGKYPRDRGRAEKSGVNIAVRVPSKNDLHLETMSSHMGSRCTFPVEICLKVIIHLPTGETKIPHGVLKIPFHVSCTVRV